MIRRMLVFTGVIVATILFLFGQHWFESIPSAIPKDPLFVSTRTSPQELPARNKQIIKFVESKGASIAPSYKTAVCTEFVIQVIEEFTPLTRQEKKAVRIITEEPLTQLVDQDAEVIKGVYTALTSGGKGFAVAADDVKPGDFVQFWNTGFGFAASGHCGIVKEISPLKSVTLYSSHPITNGYGIHEFTWPDKVYFVRMK